MCETDTCPTNGPTGDTSVNPNNECTIRIHTGDNVIIIARIPNLSTMRPRNGANVPEMMYGILIINAACFSASDKLLQYATVHPSDQQSLLQSTIELVITSL